MPANDLAVIQHGLVRGHSEVRSPWIRNGDSAHSHILLLFVQNHGMAWLSSGDNNDELAFSLQRNTYIFSIVFLVSKIA